MQDAAQAAEENKGSGGGRSFIGSLFGGFMGGSAASESEVKQKKEEKPFES